MLSDSVVGSDTELSSTLLRAITIDSLFSGFLELIWLHQTAENSGTAQKQEEYCRDRSDQCPASAEVLRKTHQCHLVVSTDRW